MSQAIGHVAATLDKQAGEQNLKQEQLEQTQLAAKHQPAAKKIEEARIAKERDKAFAFHRALPNARVNRATLSYG